MVSGDRDVGGDGSDCDVGSNSDGDVMMVLMVTLGGIIMLVVMITL